MDRQQRKDPNDNSGDMLRPIGRLVASKTTKRLWQIILVALLLVIVFNVL